MVRKKGQNCRNYRFPIYPTVEQELSLLESLETCRTLWNGFVKAQFNLFDQYGLHADFKQLEKQLKFNDNSKSIDSTVRLNVFDRFKQATLKFFKDKKEGRLNGKPRRGVLVKRKDVPAGRISFNRGKSTKNIRYDGFLPKGHPKFKSKDKYDSFTYKQYGNGWELRDNSLYLRKITSPDSLIKIDIDKPLNGDLKTCTIRRINNKWFAYITVELSDVPVPITPVSCVGIDLGLKSLLATSDGQYINPPKFYRKHEKRIAKEQQKLSRMKFRSSNYYKQKSRVNRIHRKTRANRDHFCHAISKLLANTYDLIVFEDLATKNLVRNHKLAKSIQDAAWRKIVQYTTYKAVEQGKSVELVDPKYTSQTCSGCGSRQKLALSDRVYICPSCGLVIDRDENAAVNILNKSNQFKSLCTLGLGGIQACGDTVTTVWQTVSMNQELLNLL